MTEAERAYAAALAEAVVKSVAADPPPGDLVRVVIRWFEGPDHLTIHTLGSDGATTVASEDAWYPLEWPNVDVEIERVDTIFEDPAVEEATEALSAEVGEESSPWDAQQRL